MGNFFRTLHENENYAEWSLLLDWLVSNERFKGWTSGYIGEFTKKIKRLPGIGEQTYICDSIKNLKFPQRRPQSIRILFGRGDGEARDLIRHIRNGIAHGNAKTCMCKQGLFIEIKDYGKEGIQTAYIFMPLHYIKQIYTLFLEVEKSRTNNKPKRKSTKKKRKNT